MSIEFTRHPGMKYLELGGGSNPKLFPKCMGGPDVCVDVRMCFNEQGQQTVDFEANFNNLMPEIGTEDFDGVFSHFAMEHISYRNVPQFLKEVFRVLKPGGKVTFCVPNTRAQIEWLLKNQSGWDGKELFESASELLFGSQDYDENAHKIYLDTVVAQKLFADAGFTQVTVVPYGARDTDMCVQGYKPKAMTWDMDNPDQPPTVTSWPIQEKSNISQDILTHDTDWLKKIPKRDFTPNVLRTNVTTSSPVQSGDGDQVMHIITSTHVSEPPMDTHIVNGEIYTRPQLFAKDYFNGGARVGGYAREGYRDFPVHEITAQHVLVRKPSSVLEVGCARGYILKRLQDRGVRACGLEISRHCWMTRACEGIINWDVCKTPWPYKDQEFDLCYSIAVLEHIPEAYIPAIIAEMKRISRRSLHGIDFGEKDDGFDKTHFTLRSKAWWEDQFSRGPLYGVEILDKEELERGTYPPDLQNGDGKVKVNVGCFTLMFHRGWANVDMVNLAEFARPNGYNFIHYDVRRGLPFGTGDVDLLYSSHFLEHLTYTEGLAFLKECRRVIKPGGAMRIIVPDASRLIGRYAGNKDMSDLDEISDGCEKATTPLGKLWTLLMDGHQAAYDAETLCQALEQAGFDAKEAAFRQHADFGGRSHPTLRQILHETTDNFPCISLYVDALPRV